MKPSCFPYHSAVVPTSPTRKVGAALLSLPLGIVPPVDQILTYRKTEDRGDRRESLAAFFLGNLERRAGSRGISSSPRKPGKAANSVLPIRTTGTEPKYEVDRPLFPPSSGKIVAVQVHHFTPRSHEVFHERLFRVVTGVDFRDCPELGVRTKDKVDTGAGPLDFARFTIVPLKHTFGCCGGLPLRIHVEQVDEEIIRQRPGSVGKDALLGLPEVRIQSAHAADQNRNLGGGKIQQLRPIHQ